MPAFPRSLLPAGLLAAALLSPAAAADFTVTTDVDSGPGSLRQAILDANAAPGSDVILFTLDPAAVTASTPQIIVTGALPDITDPVTIVGIYQVGTATSTAVEIRSTGLSAGQSILTVTSGGTTIRNLNLVSLTAGTVGLTLSGGGGNTLAGLRVGISSTNQITSAALHGIVVASDDNTVTGCRIGGASGGDGIRIIGSRNLVKSGIFGLKAGFSPALQKAPNKIGIHLLGGSNNVIGGGSYSSSESNQISANSESGIHIEGGSGHRILGNRVDANSEATTDSVLGNGGGRFLGNQHGIRIDGGATEIAIEGMRVGATNGSNITVNGPARDIHISHTVIVGGLTSGISVGEGVNGLIIEDSSISSMNYGGIYLRGGTASSGPVLIRHNKIFNNGRVGVEVWGDMGQVTIGTRREGAVGSSNKIWGHYYGGIRVNEEGARVRISQNAIQPVSGPMTGTLSYRMPIDLSPPVVSWESWNPNDNLDVDVGPNGMQNHPVITAVEARAGTEIRITGTLHSKPLTTYVIEALQHSAAAVPPLDFDSGFLAEYLGSTTVTTDAAGNALISLIVSGYTDGWKAALTATSPDGETSEYSNEEVVGFAPPFFPLLGNQTSFSFPENDSATGFAYSIMRPEGSTGAFNATISAQAAYAMPPGSPGSQAPSPPLKYRFNPTETWTNLNWSTTVSIPFTATDSQRVIYLTAFDDTSWDPANKPGKLWISSGPGSLGNQVPLQFPDNDPPPVFTATNTLEFPLPPSPGIPEPPAGYYESSASYPSSRIRFIADRTASVEMNYRITINAAQSTAVHGQDFLMPSYISSDPFAVGYTTRIVPGTLSTSNSELTPINDNVVEGDEIVSFNIVSTTGGIPYSAVVPLTLKDDDFLQVSIADASVVEGNSGTTLLTFPIALGKPSSTDVTMVWIANTGTAESPTDFTAVSGTVTIPAGATGATVAIEVHGDTSVEAHETFIVTVSNPSAPDVPLADASAVGTITNDDFPAVSLASLAVSEAEGSIVLTATLSEAAPFPSSVVYTLVNGTATRPSDYTGAVSATLNFPAGSTSASLTVGIGNDTVDEQDETFKVQFGAVSNITLVGTGATVTIMDNDVPALLTPSIVNVVEGDAGIQTIPITLSLGSAAINSGSFDWQVNAGLTGATAASGTASFLPGATSVSLSLTLPGNLIPLSDLTVTEDQRRIKLQLSNPVEVSLPFSEITVVRVTDNDGRLITGIGVSVTEGNEGTTAALFRIGISAPLEVPVTVQYQTENGTALAGSDYIAASGTATIPAGSTGTDIAVTILADTSPELDETFQLRLSEPVNAEPLILNLTGTIQNDDFPVLSQDALPISEAAGSIVLTATLNQAAPFDSSVGYTLVNGTATRPGDYTGSVTGRLNFPAGSTSASLTVGIVNDSTPEPDEAFTVLFSSPSGLTLGNGTATVTILDNDAPALLTPSVVNIVEGDSGSQTLPVTLTLNTAAIRAGSLNWKVTADSTAVETASGSVNFAPGAISASLSLTIPGNLVPHPRRSVKLQVSNPLEINLPVFEFTVASITDNDERSITGSAVSLAEGNGGTTIALFPISISAPLDVPVTVEYQTANGTALAGYDYTAASGTATIPAGAITADIPVTILADTTLELAETFSVQLSAPVNATMGTVSLAGTIQNDDAQPTLQISPATVTSGTGGPFRAWIEVKLPEADAALPISVAYRVTTRDGTALAGIHYTSINGGTLTFPAGNGTPVSQWIAISVAGNQAGAASNPTTFHVDFATVSGPAVVLSTEVKIEPLRITEFSRLGLGFYTVSFPTGIAQNYVIQQAASLIGPWSDKTSVIPGSGNPVREYLLFSSDPRSYFRVRSYTSPPATPAVLTP